MLIVRRQVWLSVASALLLPSAGLCQEVGPQIVSLADSASPPSISGNSDSTSAFLSGAGQRVVFVSRADNLVSDDTNGSRRDVFVRDLATGETFLVSRRADGQGSGNGPSNHPRISEAGQFVVFESSAENLAPEDDNGASDIFLHDLDTGETALISRNQAGTASGNGASFSPAMTPSGRFIAFASRASDLTAADDNDVTDVFLFDRQDETLIRASRDAQQFSPEPIHLHEPLISDNGRTVVFIGGWGHEFSRDRLFAYSRETQSLQEINPAPAGADDSFSLGPLNVAINATGEYVAFQVAPSDPDLVNPGIFYADLVQGDIQPVALVLDTSNRVNLPDFSGPSMSDDGRLVAFEALNPALQNAHTLNIWNADTEERELIGNRNFDSSRILNASPVLSPDGRYVAFLSRDNSLVETEANDQFQIYVRDRNQETTTLITQSPTGEPSQGVDMAGISFSADSSRIAFQCRAGDLVNQDLNETYDVFIAELSDPAPVLVSHRDSELTAASAAGFSSLDPQAISEDGRYAAFTSMADNLVPNDRNGRQDVFVRDLQTEEITLVSVNLAGDGSGNGYSGRPVMSAGGRFVAFVSTAGNLVEQDTNGRMDVFVRDLEEKTTRVVSVHWQNSDTGNDVSTHPAISGQGKYVAFQSKATDLTDEGALPGFQTFLRDLEAGTTVRLSQTDNAAADLPGNGLIPTLSDNGEWAAFLDYSTVSRINVYNVASGETILVNNYTPNSNLSMSAGGQRLAFVAYNGVHSDEYDDRGIYLYDTESQTYELVTVNQNGEPSTTTGTRNPMLSAKGRFVVFTSLAGDLVDNDPDETRDVFVRDMQADETVLVTVNLEGTSGNGRSDHPAISADGRYVVFRSFADDLVEGDDNDRPDIFLRDLETGTTTLLSRQGLEPAPAEERSIRPVISANGEVVLFQSYASDLAADDFNQSQDVFYFRIGQSAGSDSDQDGMDDDWEQLHFGDLARDGSGDLDEDGLSDLDEFHSDTDPTNGESVFEGKVVFPETQDLVVLNWPAADGNEYQVQYKDELSDPQWQELNGTIEFDSDTGRATFQDDSVQSRRQRFYRVLLIR